MKTVDSIEAYIEQHPKWASGLWTIASILEATELKTNIKWNAPVYTINAKNVIGLAAFKNYFGIWFYNGVFLSDPDHVLVNAQDGKTKALRQMRFRSNDDVDQTKVRSYVIEAIDNEKQGKKLIPDKKKIEVLLIPEPLLKVLDNDKELIQQFNKLSSFRQREYCEYIDNAKRAATKDSRVLKILPMIRSGVGLNDKYRL